MENKIEHMYEWIENEDIDAIKEWIETTENIDAVFYSEFYDEEDEDYYEETWSKPALYVAVSAQKPKIVQLLLEHGANPNLKTHQQDTPLYKAVEEQNIDMVGLLLAFGANPSLTGKYGKTPLMCAVSDQSNANYQEQHQYNLLDPAKKEIKLRIIKLLLKAGADPNGKVGSFPLSAYELSAQRLDRDVMKLLKEYMEKKL